MGWLPAPDFSDCCETSTIIQAWLRRAARFQHVCAPGTACLALTQSGLTLAAEDGEGTQADFQFFRELGAACSQEPCLTVLKASEVPSRADWGAEPRKCISRER